jgi:RNA polymerase sigma factor (sigma-70 family)
LSESSPELSRDARFTILYDVYYHRILGYAQRRTGRDDAVDIVAETFAIAWRRLDDVPRGEQSLYWLYATARRVLANHRRAERRRADLISAIEGESLAGSSPPPRIESRRVAPALARLREDERELLLLVAWEGLDASAVAAVLRCSPNAARIRIHRARRRFADALAAVDDELKRSGSARHAFSAGAPTGTLELED